MLYFVPDWVDIIDPDYDFERDEFSRKGKERHSHDICAHEIFNPPPYDGILVSLSVIEAMPPARRELARKGSIRKHLRIEDGHLKDLIIMGDCGAFSYVNEEKPRYNVEEVVSFYEEMDFDWGVAPDHLVVDQVYEMNSEGKYELDENGKRKTRRLTDEEKKERKRITLENASEFLKGVKGKGFPFIPFASAQGWDVESYQDSVCQLIDMGYTHITIGGMARRTTNTIKRVLSGIHQTMSERKLGDSINLHLLGVGRLSILEDLVKNGITSFDSGSFYRNAWTRETHNYYSKNNGWYAAIRIPQAKRSRMRVAAQAKNVSLKTLGEMEQNALEAIRAYDRGEIGMENALLTLLKYDQLLFRNGVDGKLEEMYRRTLRDKPWKQCGCEICTGRIGVDVIIFRGGDRNRRRGFHNLKMFYEKLQAELQRFDNGS